MAQIVLGAAGAVVGYLVGGPQGAAIGWGLGSAVGAQFAPPQRAEGPRISDLRVTGTEYGDPIPFVIGHPVTRGQIWWASDRRAIPTTTTQDGKGGGPSVETTTYSYEVDLLIGVSANPIVGVARAWFNGKLIYNVNEPADGDVEASGFLGTILTVVTSVTGDTAGRFRRLTVYPGAADQLPDPTYEAAVGVGNAPAYRGRGSVFIEGLQLGGSGQIPNLTFEVFTKGTANGGFYADDFADGIAAYAGDTAFFESGSGDYGPLIRCKEVSSGGSGEIISRSITEVVAQTVSVYFRVTDSGQTGDAAPIVLRDGATSRFVVLPRREAAFDPARRCGVQLHAGAVHYFGASALTVDRWYRVVFNIQPGSGATQAGLYAADTSELLQTITFAGSFSPQSVDTLEFQADSIAGGDPTEYSRLSILSTGAIIEDETLEDTVTSLCLRCGMDASQFDATALAAITKPVRAMSISQVTSTRQVLEALASTHQFDCASTDKARFVARGGNPVLTIPFAALGVSASPEGDAQPFSPLQRGDIQVPADLSMAYMNIDADCSRDVQQSDRLTTEVRTRNTFEVPIGLTASEAKAIVDAMLVDQQVSAFGVSIAVLSNYAKLTPTDVVLVVDEAGTVFRMRVVKRNDSGQVLGFELVLDDASVLIQDGVTIDDYEPDTGVSATTDTILRLLDTAILRDADDDAGFYGATRGVDAPYPGSRVLKSVDDVTFTPVVDITESAVIGFATDALASPASLYVWDEASSITVTIGNGALSSSTRAAMQADKTINVAALRAGDGWEILRFRTASLVSTGVYRLSGFLRGMRGTGWAVGLHAIDDPFVVLSTSGVRRLMLETDEIGVSKYWRGITLGRPLSSASSQSFAGQAVGKMPFSPVNLRAARDTSGNITFTWNRRTRLTVRYGGAGGSMVPLGEDTEAFEVDVYDSGVVVRTIAVTSESASYTAAEQTADFGGVLPAGFCDAEVFQLSAIVGRGYGCRKVL